MDWSYGRILAVHLEPVGASYRAQFETFLRGTPLNLTDLEFGPDGALYFITGGRGTQSGLYRVSYIGEEPPAQTTPASQQSRAKLGDAVALRRRLESFHGQRAPEAIEILWPPLASSDRFIRYAARIALESQDVSRWEDRALSDTNATAALTALLGLARVGQPASQPRIVEALERFPFETLSEEQQLLKLRVIQVSLLRQGQSDLAQKLTRTLESRYPADTWPLNRELSRILLYLGAESAVRKSLDLLDGAPTQEQQFHYVSQLRNVRTGWSLADRRRYFEWWLKPRQNLDRPAKLLQWFADVGRSYVDGAYVDRYLREFRADAIAVLSSTERTALAELINRPFQKALLVPAADRAFVGEWTMSDLVSGLEEVGAGRNFERGRQAFVDAQCITCHRFGNDGGSIGPELTGAASKYDRRSLLESLLEPSKVVSEQYQNVTISTRDGDSFTGRVVRESEERLVIETDPLSGSRETIRRDQVESIQPSALSPMPQGLANVLTREEILDLLAYLESGGRGDAAAFKSQAK